MLSVYFVDDDSLIIEELKVIIDWEKYGYKIVGSSTSPFVAEKEIERLNPCLVIIDVQMRGLTGLELADKLSKSTSSKFVFLSAYDKFDYAVEAMKIGAIRYLKKPISEKSLIEILEKVKENEINDFNSKVYSLTSESLSNDTIKYLDNCFEECNLFPEHNKFRFICTKGNIQNSNLFSLLDKYSNYYQVLYSDEDLTTLVVFNLEYNKFKNELLLDNYSLSISNEQVNFESIYNIFKRVRICSNVKFLGQNNKIIDVDLIDSSEEIKKDIDNCQNIYDFQQKIIDLKNIIIDNDIKVCDIQKLYNACVYGMYKFKIVDSIEDLLSLSVVNFYENIDEMIEDLLCYFNNVLEDDDLSYSSIIDEIKEHLKENIDRKISLSFYAKKYNYSSSNLSILFKRYVGMSFIEYTTSLKMDMAQFLIINYPNKSFKEIANSVGYDDYYHFSKMFKKTCHCTPALFREKYKK